jgi:outer membrane protein OmpA-like peptidoglycan-associated protein
MRKWLPSGIGAILLVGAGCAPKRVEAPPPPPPARVAQNVFVLLPNPDGKPSSIVVTNQAGTQEIKEPGHAVRIERADVAPTAPFAFDADSVKKLFGVTEDNMPAPELIFVLHFDENKDVLTPESEERLPEIFRAIRERHSTMVTVTGHTDTTGTAKFNDELAMKRAQNVAGIFRTQGLDSSSLFVTSHGAADLLVKTGPGVSEPLNRRVEVIVR